MLQVEATVINLGNGKLGIYLPKSLVEDSAFTLKAHDRVKITADGACLTVCKIEGET